MCDAEVIDEIEVMVIINHLHIILDIKHLDEFDDIDECELILKYIMNVVLFRELYVTADDVDDVDEHLMSDMYAIEPIEQIEQQQYVR